MHKGGVRSTKAWLAGKKRVINLKKSTFIFLISALGAFLAAYAAAIVGGNVTAPYIMAPLGALAAGVITLNAYIKPLAQRAVPVIWLLLSAAFFTWAAAEVLRAVRELGMGASATENLTILHLRTIMNLATFVSSTIFIINQVKRWNRAKLVLDAVMYSIMVLTTFWILLLNRDITLVGLILRDGPLSAGSILSDVLSFMMLAIWILSVKRGKVPLHISFVVAGMMMFVLTDLYSYHVVLNVGYSAGSFINVQYMGAMLLIALGGIVRLYRKNITTAQTLNVFGNRVSLIVKYTVLLAVPLAAMAVTRFVAYELLIYLVLVAAYAVISFYFMTAIKKDVMLVEERRINNELEQIIASHTQDLRSMNEALAQKNDELRIKNDELAVISNRDMLTGLYNRRYLLQWLEEHISQQGGGEPLTLMYIDIDRFKLINDTYGHELGDKVLVEFAKCLSEISCDCSVLARMGSDEFVYVYTRDCDNQFAAGLAQKIGSYCRRVIYVDGYEFSLEASIGISKYPIDAQSVGSLLRNADIALFSAKERGVGRTVTFSEMIRQKTQRRNTIEMLLRQPDITREMLLYYQPQFSVPDNKLIGAEALLRWRNPDIGMIPPGEFIPIAEESDSINNIGIWVLQQAAQQAAKWNTQYGGALVVGVNVSPRQLNSSSLISQLNSLKNRTDFDPAWLDIEVTESVAMEGEYRLTQIFSLFKSIGMSTSIDDFGTGYSSISSLKNFPFDRIKIAKPLVDSLTVKEKDEQIVKAIVLLADAIGMKTIAEGVETQAQYNKLKELGCDQIQGYLLGRPVPAEEFEALYLCQKTNVNTAS